MTKAEIREKKWQELLNKSKECDYKCKFKIWDQSNDRPYCIKLKIYGGVYGVCEFYSKGK